MYTYIYTRHTYRERQLSVPPFGDRRWSREEQLSSIWTVESERESFSFRTDDSREGRDIANKSRKQVSAGAASTRGNDRRLSRAESSSISFREIKRYVRACTHASARVTLCVYEFNRSVSFDRAWWYALLITINAITRWLPTGSITRWSDSA